MPLTVESSGPRDLTTRSRRELARSMTVTAPSSYFRATAHSYLLQLLLFRLLERGPSGLVVKTSAWQPKGRGFEVGLILENLPLGSCVGCLVLP